MNTRKQLYLFFAGLLTVPLATHANYVSPIILKVPIEIINLQPTNFTMEVKCTVGAGPYYTTGVGYSNATIRIPASRNYSGTLTMDIYPGSGGVSSLYTATHYKCKLSNSPGQVLPPGLPEVSGAIPPR